MSLVPNGSATVTATLKVAGTPITINSAWVVTAQLFDAAGAVPISAQKPLSPTAIGAKWPAGLVIADFSAADTAAAAYPAVVARFVVDNGAGDTRSWDVEIAVDDVSIKSALFPNKAMAVAALRRDRLMMAASGAMPKVDVSDDYLWSKLMAAESELRHTLRVPLTLTQFFPERPTDDEIAALAGMPWDIDPGYDYHPASFQYNDRWGSIKLRQKPVGAITRVRFAYPGGHTAHYDLPVDWVRVDRKYGHVQFVPSSTAFAAPLNTFVMQAIGNGRTIPLAIQVTYTAGLNAKRDYPEILDLVQKMASLKIIEDAFLPQSGSISADGMSQSMSNDMSKHHETIDRIINGDKGGNGGLMAAIHGIRLGVV